MALKRRQIFTPVTKPQRRAQIPTPMQEVKTAYTEAMRAAPTNQKVFKVECSIWHYNSFTDTWFAPPYEPYAGIAGGHLYMPAFLFHHFDFPHYGIGRQYEDRYSAFYPFDVNDNQKSPPALWSPRFFGVYEVGMNPGLFQNDNAVLTPRNTLTVANMISNMKLVYGDLVFMYAENGNFGYDTVLFDFVKISAIDRPYTALLKENHKISTFLMHADYKPQFNQPLNFIESDQVGRYKIDPYQPLANKSIDTVQNDFIRVTRPFTADLHNGFSFLLASNATKVTFEFVGNY